MMHSLIPIFENDRPIACISFEMYNEGYKPKKKRGDSKLPKLQEIPFPTRTKETHPYNYDAYVQYVGLQHANSSVWSDRMMQQDFTRFNALLEKHFGNQGQLFGPSSGRQPSQIEAFLKDWYEDPNLRLARISEWCNQSSGYPLWHFNVITEKYKCETTSASTNTKPARKRSSGSTSRTARRKNSGRSLS